MINFVENNKYKKYEIFFFFLNPNIIMLLILKRTLKQYNWSIFNFEISPFFASMQQRVQGSS